MGTDRGDDYRDSLCNLSQFPAIVLQPVSPVLCSQEHSISNRMIATTRVRRISSSYMPYLSHEADTPRCEKEQLSAGPQGHVISTSCFEAPPLKTEPLTLNPKN